MNESLLHRIHEETSEMDYNVKMVIRRFFGSESTLKNLIDCYDLTVSQKNQALEFIENKKPFVRQKWKS